jgi:hypothetical protein
LAENVNKALGWVKSILERFQPFRPDVNSMIINYREQRSEIWLHIKIPSGMRRHLASVKIPAFEDFDISFMMDRSLHRMALPWKLENKNWVLNPSVLLSDKDYLVVMKGPISKRVLDELVRVQPAMNRDQTPSEDKYWLSCMIRNQKLLETMYQELQIQEIDVKVKVGIERCFSTAVPPQLKKQLDTMDRWVQAGLGKDRGEVTKAWSALRFAYASGKIDQDSIASIVKTLTENEIFRQYVTVEPPFIIGDVRRNERFAGLIPNEMFVEAITELSLRRPECTGYLCFKKKDYIEIIKHELNKIAW